MNLTKKFFDDHLRDLKPDAFKAAVLLLYEPESTSLKLSRTGATQWLGVSERVARQALNVLKVYQKMSQKVSRASACTPNALGQKSDPKCPKNVPESVQQSVQPKTIRGILVASIFPEAPDPDTTAQKAQAALGAGLTFKRGWKYELEQCREWHEDHKPNMNWRQSATSAVRNWCSRGVEFEKTMPIPPPKPVFEVVEKDFSEGWVEKP